MNTRIKKGFTLIELIFVIVILGILSAVAIPNLAKEQDQNDIKEVKSKEVKAQISEVADVIRGALDKYSPKPVGEIKGSFKNKFFQLKDNYIELGLKYENVENTNEILEGENARLKARIKTLENSTTSSNDVDITTSSESSTSWNDDYN